MDGFMNMAKSGYSAYQAHNSQQDVNKTGGSEYNQPEHDFDHDQAVQKASSNAAGSGDSSLFSQALSYATSNKSAHQQPVDEESTINAHKTAYEDGDASKLDANGIGGAAALQILKQYTSGGSGGGGGGKSQSDLIGLAMSEAAKLFDSKGGAQSGDKQEAVNGAAMTIVKLLVQSKFGGGTTGGADQKPGLGSLLGGGGSGGGGSGQLLSMASQYLK
ncbi:hypothetical protein BKA62DRAFT_825636 [Auriculariales sp. MPI-PUGE-AT-0066]|nr:hypothetical protein BKA62DRAFT_825636 [Auriculariales sp. MPI-PUGE-AT-0066]